MIVIVFVSRLPLSDCVPIVVAATVVFWLRLEGGCHGDKNVDRGCVDIVVDDKGLLPVRVPTLCCCLCVTIAIAIAIVGCC